MGFSKISVITPSFNRKDMLEIVIKNVVAQNFPNMEHIVVDGGSDDGTQNMVKKYPHVKFICEPDKGMYDALNKGLDASTGDIIGFLNTDDMYADNIFFDVVDSFNKADVMAVAGCAVVFYKTDGGDAVTVGHYSPTDRSLLECSTIGSNYFNAWFFRKSVFETIGKFNADYRIAGDRDLMLRFAFHGLHYGVLEKVVYQYLQHPESLTFHDTDEKREATAREHLSMSSLYLKDKNLSRLTRKLLIQLRTKETIDVATRAVRKGDLRKFFHYLYEGMEKDYLWSLKFVWSALVFRYRKGLGFLNKYLQRIRIK